MGINSNLQLFIVTVKLIFYLKKILFMFIHYYNYHLPVLLTTLYTADTKFDLGAGEARHSLR